MSTVHSAYLRKLSTMMRESFGTEKQSLFLESVLLEHMCYSSNYLRELSKGEMFMHAFYALTPEILSDALSKEQIDALTWFVESELHNEVISTEACDYREGADECIVGRIMFDILEFNYHWNGDPTLDQLHEAHDAWVACGLLPAGWEFRREDY